VWVRPARISICVCVASQWRQYYSSFGFAYFLDLSSLLAVLSWFAFCWLFARLGKPIGKTLNPDTDSVFFFFMVEGCPAMSSGEEKKAISLLSQLVVLCDLYCGVVL